MTDISAEVSTDTQPITLMHPLAQFFSDESETSINRRATAWSFFETQGLPTKVLEQWKYTDIRRQLKGLQFDCLHKPTATADGITDILPEEGAWMCVFIDGHFSAEHSKLEGLPAGVHLKSIKNDPAALQNVPMHDDATLRSNPLLALNNALYTDGVSIQIDQDITVSKPIYLIYNCTDQDKPLCFNYSNVIQVEAGASVRIIEKNNVQGVSLPLINAQTNIRLDAKATLDFTSLSDAKTQAYCLNTTYVTLSEKSDFRHFSLALTAPLIRHTMAIDLNAPFSQCTLAGFYLAKAKEHIDHHLYINHAASHTNSQQFYKGVADDVAHAVFNGKVVVQKGIEKVDTKQTNRNLLLSTKAEIDTKPELEIYSDDVKCAHGATVGQLDEKALFYLQSRGISEAVARAILTRAFGAKTYGFIRDENTRQLVSNLLLEAMNTHFNATVEHNVKGD